MDGRTPQDGVPALWHAIRASLEAERRRITREIRSYPTPIAGCDVQFNFLIEERESIANELRRIDAVLSAPAPQGPEIAAVGRSMLESRHLDSALKRKLRGDAASAR